MVCGVNANLDVLKREYVRVRCKYGNSLAVQLHCILVILRDNQEVYINNLEQK